MGARTDKLKGKLKQIEGKLTGDKVRMAQGTAEKAKGGVEATASRAVRATKRAVHRATTRAKASFARTTR